MFADFTRVTGVFKTVAVAVSGGKDSMALLHYAFTNAEKLGVNVVCLNVEHGIRGENSVNDSRFVYDYCERLGIDCLKYSVNSVKKAATDKLSIEQAARELRYECFTDAVKSGKCEAVLTAHHISDNAETVLFNLFRGTGLKGLSGITDKDRIIRPLIGTTREEIDEYIRRNDVPFVTDETNLSDEYTRNYIRHNVLPAVKKIFPEAEKRIYALSRIAASEDAYLDELANRLISKTDDGVKIAYGDEVLVKRAALNALKLCGVKKDWAKTHAESVALLMTKETAKRVNLTGGVVAIKEYDGVTLFKSESQQTLCMEFGAKTFVFCGAKYTLARTPAPADYKTGFYIDENKIPQTAVIRTRKKADTFTKFGGGTKSLSDFFTDKKIPIKERDRIALVADRNVVYAVLGIAISDKAKADENTRSLIKITREEI